MLGRLTKETNFNEQDKLDRDMADAILKLKWSPSAIQGPQYIQVPTAKECNSDTDSSVLEEEDEKEEESVEDEKEDEEKHNDDEGQEQKNEEQKENKEQKQNESDEVTTNAHESETNPAASGTATQTVGDIDSEIIDKNTTKGNISDLQVPQIAEGGQKVANEEDNGNSRQTRRQRSARLKAAAAAAATVTDSSVTSIKALEESSLSRPDRQKLAVEHREEANELHRRCLTIACSGILQAMIRRDPLCLFAEPVPTNVVGYSAVVKNPIDFTKIRSIVQRGKYTSLGAFINDARLLCTNALAFNPPGSIYSKTAKELYDILDTFHDRARKWMSVIKDTHSAAFARRVDALGRNSQPSSDEVGLPSAVSDDFADLRESWPEAVEILESGDWLRDQIASDFTRTRENEVAYYGAIAIRRTAAAAEASLASYTDSMSTFGIAVRRTQLDDEALREAIDEQVAKVSAPMQLKDIPKFREESIVKIMRRVQSRRVESRITSESGCARCDGMQLLTEDTKLSLQREALQHGIVKKAPENDSIPRVNESRLYLTTGLASANARKLIGRDIDGSIVSGSQIQNEIGEKQEAADGVVEGLKSDQNTDHNENSEMQVDKPDQQGKGGDDTQEDGGKGELMSEASGSGDSKVVQTSTSKWDRVHDVQVNVKGSKIHGWGLYADQPFKKGDVVAEYVGEYVCNAVADKREKLYQERRIQDYQFRVGENLVIDATLKGGHGRYINHNCNPNCYAQIIDGMGARQHLKRVMIIAQRDIKAREEITYDYQFPLELDLDSRIPCNCGSLLCRGFMNWDLPEKGSKNRVLRGQKRGGNIRDRIRRLGKPLKR